MPDTPDARPAPGLAPGLGSGLALGLALSAAPGCATTPPEGIDASAPPAVGAARAIPGPPVPPDADADGVGDPDDLCPESRTGLAIDARGCSVLDGPLAGVSFRPGRAELGRRARAALDPLARAILGAPPGTIVAIEAHTDNRGRAATNLELSKRRTMSVVRYLVTRGVPAEALRPAGFGEGRPVAPNATEAGRRANRRIEVRVLSPAPQGAPVPLDSPTP